MASREPWRNVERHYCAVCNAWMGSDRQSIIIHENGKKHIENMRKQMKERQQNKIKQEREQSILERSLLQMEKIASSKQAEDSKFFGNQLSYTCTPAASSYPILSTSTSSQVASSQQPLSTTQPKSNESKKKLKKEMESWKDRKKRKEDHRDNSSQDENSENDDKKKLIRKQLGPNEGHYSVNDHIYLKGKTYAPLIKKDMAIEIWTGFREAKSQDQEKIENQSYWKTGLVCEIHKNSDSIETSRSQDDDNNDFTCDVAYLSNPSDDDETYEKNVGLNRIRICVGSGNDDPESDIPGSLEEARLELMGGEEIISFEGTENNKNTSFNNLKEENILDENTGFSSWNTVSIRKVTVNKELMEERNRLKEKRKLERELEEQNKKKIQERKMEETKHADANDSALGAYDVWNVSSKAKDNVIGYKGVDVNTENKVDHVVDAISKLSKKSTDVGFKKKKSTFGGNLKKKKFRRVTSADD